MIRLASGLAYFNIRLLTCLERSMQARVPRHLSYKFPVFISTKRFHFFFISGNQRDVRSPVASSFHFCIYFFARKGRMGQ